MTGYDEGRAAGREAHNNTDKAFRRVVVAAIVASGLAVCAFLGTAYAIVNQQIVATNLCRTINAASRGPDDVTHFNPRQEYRELWKALGYPARAAAVPDAPPLDCKTGKPTTKEEAP